MSMTWNYRIIRHQEPGKPDWLGPHEVFYEPSGDVVAVSYAEEPEVTGYTVEEIVDAIKMMLADAEKAASGHHRVLDKAELLSAEFVLPKDKLY